MEEATGAHLDPHDLSELDPASVEKAFRQHAANLNGTGGGRRALALDGKALRGSFDAFSDSRRGNQRAAGRRGSRTIRRLRDQHIAVMLISHRMPDVFAVADRVVVLRRGRKVADKPIKSSSPEEVTGLITGAIHVA